MGTVPSQFIRSTSRGSTRARSLDAAAIGRAVSRLRRKGLHHSASGRSQTSSSAVRMACAVPALVRPGSPGVRRFSPCWATVISVGVAATDHSAQPGTHESSPRES